ncbi:MAG: TniB family NTP-binding protein [Chloroflexi bacterium]|nr:TniB family NTP-binding protein [Chloroflexota bacterium]
MPTLQTPFDDIPNDEQKQPHISDTGSTGNTISPSPQERSLTRKEICRLPGPERLPYVEQILVRYPLWRDLAEELHRCYQMNRLAAEPQCKLLVGPTGAGKTTLVESVASLYPTVYTATGVRRPVLKATIPAPATIKNLATVILYGLGDPLAGKGTIGSMTMRIIRFINDCQVGMLVLDELQHFLDRDSKGKVLQNVSDWLKTVIKETRVACVLVGLKGEAEQVVFANPQLARLFGDPTVLYPFEWDVARPDTIREFRTLLREIERALPLNRPSNLAGTDLAARCYAASEGLVGYLMALIRWAAGMALLEGRECLDAELLAVAFDQRLGGERRKIANPFRGDAPIIPSPTKPRNQG